KVPRIPPPHYFTYTLRVYKGKTSLDDLEEFVDSQVVEDVDHESIMRSKKFASRAKIKDLLKSVVDANADGKLVIQNGIVATTRLDTLEWEDVFAGPLPEFPQRKNRRINKKDADTPRGRSSKGNAGPHRSPKRRDSVGGGSPSKKGKAREDLLIKIKAQQEELQQTFEKAERLGMEGLARWRQTDRLLKPADLEALTRAISSARLESREKAREKRLREREEQLMWKKPRDDLLCDDLEPLPDFCPIQLPGWFAPEMFGDLLSVQNFLHCFSEVIVGDGSAKYSFPELVKAVLEPWTPTSQFLDIVTMLLQIRTKCADDEDGDEADIDNPEEVGWNDPNCELDHPVHGSRIRDINKLHETLRCAFGRSVRHLPVDRKTVTEVLRLTLETSGYYLVYNNPRRGRNLGARGGNKCYEDAGFQFVAEHRDIVDRLRETTVFEVTPEDRVKILHVIVQQLLSYMKFRVEIDARLDNMYQRRREFKQLRIRDVQQEKDAKDARLAQEFHQDKVRELGEEEALKLKLWQPKKPGKATQKLLAYVKATNEGRR
ncbi:bromodomain containing protein, partial [Aphelenchoides avenae]